MGVHFPLTPVKPPVVYLNCYQSSGNEERECNSHREDDTGALDNSTIVDDAQVKEHDIDSGEIEAVIIIHTRT